MAHKPTHVPNAPLQFLVEPRYIKQFSGRIWLPVLSLPHLTHPHIIPWRTPQIAQIPEYTLWISWTYAVGISSSFPPIALSFLLISSLLFLKFSQSVWINWAQTVPFHFPFGDGVISPVWVNVYSPRTWHALLSFSHMMDTDQLQNGLW